MPLFSTLIILYQLFVRRGSLRTPSDRPSLHWKQIWKVKTMWRCMQIKS